MKGEGGERGREREREGATDLLFRKNSVSFLGIKHFSDDRLDLILHNGVNSRLIQTRGLEPITHEIAHLGIAFVAL